MDKKKQLLEELISEIKTKEEFDAIKDQLFKRGIESLLNAEMTAHLGYPKHEKAEERRSNSRNGSTSKIVKTTEGELQIDVPRDRSGAFDPVTIPKHSRMSQQLEEVIMQLYAKGMSTHDISDHMNQMYGIQYTASAISTITNQLLEDISQWQNRPLESIYSIVWLDAIRYKVKQDSRIVNKAILVVIGLKMDGKKDVLGLWVYENESSAFWLEVLNELKIRGVEDLLIVSSDNLKGLTEAITAAFPKAVTQICIVHQIRNSLKHVSYKDRKGLLADLKKIYQAPSEKAAREAFEQFKSVWIGKYGYAVKSWETNWENLTHFLGFPPEIRRIIYTTNVIESFNAVLRKFTRNKKQFPHDDAVLKSVWLAVQQISRKWTMTVSNWGMIINQLNILFPERLKLY
ncbi:MAG TPA: IS256 family transposase [Saprospiraceae bacterium]|nr:IS256 family transposase [Saprospiraceae bacterium]